MKTLPGTWASHLKPVTGGLEWTVVPHRAHTAMVGGRVFAVIRREKNYWTVSIPGFLWDAMGAAQTLGLSCTTTKSFPTVAAARRAVMMAYQERKGDTT